MSSFSTSFFGAVQLPITSCRWWYLQLYLQFMLTSNKFWVELYKIFHAILTASDTFQTEQFLTLQNQAGSDTFQFWQFPFFFSNGAKCGFWLFLSTQCFPIKTNKVILCNNFKKFLSANYCKINWVACSTPHALSPNTLSPDALSPRALSHHALSPNGLRYTWKNQALQVDLFMGIYPNF